MRFTHSLWMSLGLASLGHGEELPDSHSNDLADLHNTTHLGRDLAKRDSDPLDFGWIKRWAAIGDSYTAGIGSGAPLNTMLLSPKAWTCSRYDASYASILDMKFGSAVEDFQYLACAGDRTPEIYEQAKSLKGDLDLVVLTAGLTDLCMAPMLKFCVLFAATEDACASAINTAQANLDNILRANIQKVLLALNDKMRGKDSIVILSGYAQLFNTESDDCNGEDWSLMPSISKALPLTKQRRERFNKLVQDLNTLLKDVVKDLASTPEIKYKLGYSHWDPWVYKGVHGQFCDPDSSGHYPDEEMPDLQFMKFDTSRKRKDKVGSIDPRRVEATGPIIPPEPLPAQSYQNSILTQSRNPAAVAIRALAAEAPSPPGCPGDTSLVSRSIPDYAGKYFHPNNQGHLTMASFVVDTMARLRADILGVDGPPCPPSGNFICWFTEGRDKYAKQDLMARSIDSFCGDDWKPITINTRTVFVKTYHKGTPDEHRLATILSTATKDVKSAAVRKDCRESLERLLRSCETSPDLQGYQFGGMWERGDGAWQLSPRSKGGEKA